MNIKNIFWWLLFFPIAIIIQRLIPGLDALLIGLIIIIQEKRYKYLTWFLPAIIILQEGMGSREFGGSIAWYFTLIAMLIVASWLFEVKNLIFIIFLSILLSLAYFLLVYFMAPLQGLSIDYKKVLEISLYQIFFIPLAWWLTSLSRTGVRTNEERP